MATDYIVTSVIKENFLILTNRIVLFSVLKLYFPEQLKNEVNNYSIILGYIFWILGRIAKGMVVEIYPVLVAGGVLHRENDGV